MLLLILMVETNKNLRMFREKWGNYFINLSYFGGSLLILLYIKRHDIYGPFHALRVLRSYGETVISQKLLGVERCSTYQKKDLIEHYKIRLFLKLYFNHGLSYRPRKRPLRGFRTILTFFIVWLWHNISANWLKIAQFPFHSIKYNPFYVFKWKN